jgi:hypothetical protein
MSFKTHLKRKVHARRTNDVEQVLESRGYLKSDLPASSAIDLLDLAAVGIAHPNGSHCWIRDFGACPDPASF